MIRINLLPWREARRKARNLQFYILMGMVAGLAASIVLLVHGYYATRISTQTERNRFLKDENTKLDKEIEEIKKLKEEIQALLSRKQVIETLQADRAQTVYLLEQLVRQTPDGIYLKSIRQTGPKVNLTGYAQSNARVSTLMRNLEASPYLENPDLVEIKVANVNNKRLSEFNMNVSIRRLQTESGAAKGGAGKTGPGKAATGVAPKVGAAPTADVVKLGEGGAKK
jgi:type IV pilus assembly protein PilN